MSALFLSVQTVDTKKFNEASVPSKKDSLEAYFDNYEARANLYLSRFPGTPITGEMLSKSAKKAYDSTGVIVPLELALAQCQWESGMGRKGRSPETNPFNVGEHDCGTSKVFRTTEEGTQAYFYLISKKYLSCKNVESLLKNFISCEGYRYASSENYEKTIKDQYFYISRWINTKIRNRTDQRCQN
jgi:hypothetical protein